MSTQRVRARTNGRVGTRAEQRIVSTLLDLIHTHTRSLTHSNKWHIDIVNSKKTDLIIFGAVSCLHPFTKSIRQHHTLRKSSDCTAI